MAAHTSKQDWGYVPQHWQLINRDKIGKMVPLLSATINTHSPSAGAGHGSLSFSLEELMTVPVLHADNHICCDEFMDAKVMSWQEDLISQHFFLSSGSFIPPRQSSTTFPEPLWGLL